MNTKPLTTLFLLGMALSIAQFVMIRDFVTVLYGEEVVIVLVTAAFFVGLSAGYLLSLRVSRRVFGLLFVASVFLHLSFPFSYRYLAVWLSRLDAGGYAFLGLLFGYALLFTAVFAAVLPRLVTNDDDERTTEHRLKSYYSVELLGFVSGFLIIAASWNRPLTYLLPVYWLLLALLLHLVARRWLLTAGFVVLATLAGAFLNVTDFHSTALLYKYKHHKRDPVVLYSVNSPYQKVEVIEDARGRRFLYLDGLQNLNTTDLEALNHYIARVPAFLTKPRRTLLIGNGTLSSVPKVYPLSGEVISVELDPAVLAASRFFIPPEQLEGLDRWRLYMDDGKRFLRERDEKFDLIIMDVPSPLTVQEAYLHTVEFYRLARDRLNESGVIAVQLSGKLQKNNRTPAQIVGALKEAFREVMVIYSDRADRGFAYASMSLPFSTADLRAATRAYERRLKIIHPNSVGRYLKRATPLSVDHMDRVLLRGWERFVDRYFDD